MVTMQGALVIIDLGTENVKYLWKGSMLESVVKVFVYRGTSLTVTHNGLSDEVVAEMKAYGIKVKEVK